jgi:hypothetical protein
MTVDYFFLVRILLSYGKREAGQFVYFPLHATKQNPFHDTRRSSAAYRNPGTIQEVSNIYFIAFHRFLPFVFGLTSNTTATFGGRRLTFTALRWERRESPRTERSLNFALKVEYYITERTTMRACD